MKRKSTRFYYQELYFIAILVFFVGTGFFVQFQQNTGILNGDFESGNLDGWVAEGQVSVAQSGTDSFTGDSLQKVAEGQYAAIIGDSTPWAYGGDQQSSLEQSVQVSQSFSQDSVLQFAYAIVANDPPAHSEQDKPRFRVLVEDITSGKVLSDTDYKYTSQTSKEWYVGNTVTGGLGSFYYLAMQDRWVFRPWQQVVIPLKDLQNHQIKIRFEVRDCNPTAHAIYGYLDNVSIGNKRSMQLPVLLGNPIQAAFLKPPFWAPFLFWFEKWGITWICCLIPLLLLLLLLWWLFRRRNPQVVSRRSSWSVVPEPAKRDGKPRRGGGALP